jgi:hypothetical protein
MYEATPIGERTWNRKQSYATTLLEMGGASNITKFAEVFGELYGGTGIDVSKIITDDNAATFAKGQSTLAEYAAAATDFTAIPAQALKTIKEQTGMDDKQIESLYKSMNVNAIDQQMTTLTSSNAFKSLKPELQSVLQDSMMYQALGIKGFTFSIKDSSGKIVNTFTSAGDAAIWMSQNSGKGYSLGIGVDQGETTGTTATEEGSTTDESSVTITESPVDNVVECYSNPIDTLETGETIEGSMAAGARAGSALGPAGSMIGATGGLIRGLANKWFEI